MHAFTIAGRELRAMLTTSMGWLVLAGLVFLLGAWWFMFMDWYTTATTDLIENPYAQEQADLSAWLITPFFHQGMSFILGLAVPAISMRLFSDDLKNRTIELLFTSPVSTAEIVLGKYLGALGFVAVMLASTFAIPLSLYLFAQPDWGVVFGGYLAAFLTCAVVIAIGMLWSAMTPHAILALALGFASFLGLWILPWMDEDPDALVKHIGLFDHIDSFAAGAITLQDATWMVTVIGFSLFATWQRVESHRWR